MRLRSSRLLPALALAAALGTFARETPAAPPTPRYAPVPPGIAALVGTPAEEALAARAIASIESPEPEAAFAARAELLLAGDAGLRRTAERLAERVLSPQGLLVALEVVSASRVPAVDVLLARAAGEDRFEARALAARGLGIARTAAATETLARLARDPMPAVRGAALRSLFAIEEPAAKAARAALPFDADPRLAALRFRLHRLRDDAGEALGPLAWRAYAGGAPASVRIEAARCLALPSTAAPERALATMVAELGGGAHLAALARHALRAPQSGYDPAAERLAAAEALLEWVRRPSLAPERRAALVDLAIGWIAHPTRVRSRSVDEEARLLLSAALPDLGEIVVEPVTRRLLADAFDDPFQGVQLLASLPPALAVPALARLLDPVPGASRPVVAAVSGALRDLGHVGDERTARALLAPGQASDVRRDAIQALRGEAAELALPLLEEALLGPDDALASTAASALAERPEPRARDALLRTIFDGRVRPYESGLLERLARRPDDALWAALDRGMRAGPRELRRSIFDAIRNPSSGLRGPRAVALVRLPMEDPSLGLDPVKIAGALSTVDGPAAVEYIRNRFARVPPDSVDARRVMLRDLRGVSEASAREFALSVAAATPDTDEGMLGEVVEVLKGRSEKDAARTDPFWRRLLKTKGVLRGVAVGVLARADEATGLPEIPRGDLAALLVPIVADDLEPTEEVRLRALQALVLGSWSGAEDFVFGIATNPREPDDLRAEAARVLVGKARPATRARALAWLREPCLEDKEVVIELGRLAGSGAGPSEAAEVLRLLEATFAAHDRSRPFARSTPEVAALETYATRVEALVAAIAASGDAPSVAALAGHLFDPRFAKGSAAAIRHEKATYSGGDDALAPLSEPPTLEALSHETERSGRHTPASPIGREIQPIVRGLKSAGRGDAAHTEAVAALVARAVADARARGDLAAFQDLWLVGIAKQLRQRDREERTGDFSAAAAAAEEALVATWPAGGPEEFLMRQRRAVARTVEGRFTEAAEDMAFAARLGAATGLSDVPPANWLDRSPTPPASWRRLRAYADLLRGAAAAEAGLAEEARAAFRRALARDPFDAVILRNAARLRARTRFDLDAAEADARRALLLDRRQGESRLTEQDRTLQQVLAAKSGTTPPPRDPGPSEEPNGED